MTPNDPGGVALRRATRTAIILPLVFALSIVVFDRKNMAVFASFGSFAMLGLADFGGPPRARIAAYLSATAVGCVLIAIATPVSGDPWLGALLMAAVGAVVMFSGVLGGYASAGTGAVTLAFVLAVTIPAPVDDIPIRLAGWVLGGIASAVAAVVLWPAHETDVIRRQARSCLDALAKLLASTLDAPGDVATTSRLRERAVEESVALTRIARDTPNRPVGPTTRIQALAYLVDESRGLTALVDELVDGDRPASEAHRSLVQATVELLETLADGRSPDLLAFEANFEVHRARTSEALVASVEARQEGERLASDLEYAFLLRAVAATALSIGANTMLADGSTLPTTTWVSPPLVPPLALTDATRRLALLARAQLRPDSVWFRNAVRAGVGLGLAVLIAGLASLSHAFWVALAVLSVLKSNAVGTRHTAMQAFVGTIAGFILASGFTEILGTSEAVLWIALPPSVFLAVYTPTAVRFVVGQAMFTVLVVVLFNLVEPEGWRVAEARVEDIGIGAATAFVVGVLLWPRGAGTALRSSLSNLFATGATFVGRAIDDILDRDDDEAETERRGLAAHAAALQTNDAFATFLDERGPKHVPAAAWASLITVGTTLPYSGDALVTLASSRGPVVGFGPQVDRLAAMGTQVERVLDEVSRALAEHRSAADVVFDDSRRAELSAVADECLAALRPSDPPDRIEGALRLAWTVDRIAATDRSIAALEQPLTEAAIARRPWWR